MFGIELISCHYWWWDYVFVWRVIIILLGRTIFVFWGMLGGFFCWRGACFVCAKSFFLLAGSMICLRAFYLCAHFGKAVLHILFV